MLAIMLVSFSNETYPALLSRSNIWSASPSNLLLYFSILFYSCLNKFFIASTCEIGIGVYRTKKY